MTMSVDGRPAAPKPLAETLSASDYIRQRGMPQLDEPFYLHLTDLREALLRFEYRNAGSVLDFGCGGSPYRDLFSTSEYKRADFTDVSGLDFRAREDGSLPEVESAQFDVVLSTQVLEHAVRPDIYLAEACRVLRPGGRLLLTTHGIFEDHPCPYDLHRWTAQGLTALVERSGFLVESGSKLTVGPRAALMFLQRTLGKVPVGRRQALRQWRDIPWYWLRRAGARGINSFADRMLGQYRAAPLDNGENDIYVALMVVGRKPTTAA